jgi:hypothetical protein
VIRDTVAQRVPVPCLIMGATGREDKARGMCHSCEDIAGSPHHSVWQ